jgi:flagellar motor switch protein FliN/FliY
VNESPAPLAEQAATALAAVLPLAVPPVPVPASETVPAVDAAVVASFVGRVSADLAVVFDATAPEAPDAPALTTADLLQPALEAATAVLGSGVLDDARVDDASALFGDESATVFELQAEGRVVGWFAIRLRNDLRRSEDNVMGRLGRISNVEMALTVEIGRTRMPVRDVLAIEPGAVIELDRSAGSAADVLLNGRLIAHGEIVVVDQDYAVRITKILDTAEELA